MATYAVEEEQLTNIADAIRTQTGSTDTLSLDDMATEISNISGGAQADWNVNDESDPAYVKNRTHYIEIGEGVMFEHTWTGYSTNKSMSALLDLAVGDMVKVVYDGTEYQCAVRTDSMGKFIGDFSKYNGVTDADADGPFMILIEQYMLYSDTEDSSVSHTIQVYGEIETVHPLDKKYLPEITKSMLPDNVVFSGTDSSAEIEDGLVFRDKADGYFYRVYVEGGELKVTIL